MLDAVFIFRPRCGWQPRPMRSPLSQSSRDHWLLLADRPARTGTHLWLDQVMPHLSFSSPWVPDSFSNRVFCLAAARGHRTAACGARSSMDSAVKVLCGSVPVQ